MLIVKSRTEIATRIYMDGDRSPSENERGGRQKQK